jgi:hypothetical protein
MCLNKTYNKVRVCKHLSDSFPIQNGLKQGDTLSQLLNFALDYAIRKVQENQVELKLKWTHQLLAYADDVNLLEDNIVFINKNSETLIDAGKEVGLKINVENTMILPVALYECETWSLTLREEHRLRVFENRVLRRIFGPKRDEVTGG